ncbi:UNVERIFIED_CONTAM: hypothetical protein FKN15_009844 [Acipenser sinensis]
MHKDIVVALQEVACPKRVILIRFSTQRPAESDVMSLRYANHCRVGGIAFLVNASTGGLQGCQL